MLFVIFWFFPKVNPQLISDDEDMIQHYAVVSSRGKSSRYYPINNFKNEMHVLVNNINNPGSASAEKLRVSSTKTSRLILLWQAVPVYCEKIICSNKIVSMLN
jgi:hypothetical protein